jgi:hypothetical protein
MAQSGGLERHQDLAVLRTVEFDLLDTPFLIDIPQHGGVHLHGQNPRTPSVVNLDVAQKALAVVN